MDCGAGGGDRRGGGSDHCRTHGGSARSRGKGVAESRSACRIRIDTGPHEDRIRRMDSFVVRRPQGLQDSVSTDTSTVVLRAAGALPRANLGLGGSCAEIRDPPRAAPHSVDARTAASRRKRGFFRRPHACKCVGREAILSDRGTHRRLLRPASGRDQWRDRRTHRQPGQRWSQRVPLRLDKASRDRRSEHPRIAHDRRRSEARRAPRTPVVTKRGSRQGRGHSSGPVFRNDP